MGKPMMEMQVIETQVMKVNALHRLNTM